ncbi:C25 family cysteine peptidase [Flavobacteriales bacterium]|nr:C25 family cysteine peptidase [Flavobacteriales bacterium]
MKSLLLVLFVATQLFCFGSDDYNIKLISQTNNTLIVEFNLQNYRLSKIDASDPYLYQNFIVNGGVTLLKTGEPELLKFTFNIQLPNTGSTSYSILETEFLELENINVTPSKGNLYRNIDPNSIPFTEGPVYSYNTDFPNNLLTMGKPYIQRDIRGQTLSFIPFKFNPLKKTVKVYKKIKIEISFNPNITGKNEIKIPVRRKIAEETNLIYNRRYLNYSNSRYNPLGQDGKMLIIAPSEYLSGLHALISWKRKSGVDVEIVNVDDIGNNETNIYNYVRNYYNQNPDFLYLLLVGDHNDVASYNAGSTWMSETKWSDSKYGLVSNSNDWYPDVYVGRFSPSNSNDLNTMIQRNLEYEVTPLISDYYQNALGIGSNEGNGYGDDGEADWQHLRNIRTDLLNFGYQNVYEFYDGSHGGEDQSGNPNSSIISNALNSGVSLFNYTGHGDINSCATGNFTSSDVTSATNSGKYPFVISVSCNNGTFTSGTCISEVWQRASHLNSPTGSIAAAGSSILMSWAPPMATQDEIVDILVESYPYNKVQTIGSLFYSGQMKMLDDYPNAGKEVIETWILFGDPTTFFRSKTPSDFIVSHDEEQDLGVSSLSVFCDEQDANVTLWNGDSLIGKTNVLNGQADFIFDSIKQIDTLEIIISAYNKTPYFGNLRIISPDIKPVSNFTDFLFGPNPLGSDFQLSLIFELNEDQEVIFEIFNALGQKIYKQTETLSSGFYGPDRTPLVLNLNKINLKTGIYSFSTNINSTQYVKQLFVP